MRYKIFTLSPGSTSTKLAVFDGEDELFKANILHDSEKLKSFARVSEQLPYRIEAILSELGKSDIKLEDMDAFSAYSGGIYSTPCGVFTVNDKILEDCTSGHLFEHPAILGAQIINQFSEQTGKPAYLVNPPDCDEFEDVARISGLKGVYRESHVHVLNQKEAAIRAAKKLGKKYDECNLIVCHIGGGLSITAQKRGKLVDGNDVLNGDGPMAPNRAGNVPVMPVIKMCYSGEFTQKEMEARISKTGGMLGLLGTDSVIEVNERIKKGDKWAHLVYEAFAYQLAKYIGSYACVLEGQVDAIVMTGGVSKDEGIVERINKYCGWIADVISFGGDFEMEALASGAIRVLSGEEEPKVYTGEPVWYGFDFAY